MKVKDRPICALRNGRVVTIDEVEERGLACNCICPECGENLIARKGEHNIHHFSHKVNSNCAYGYQSSLHLMAKDIINNTDYVYLPELTLRYPNIIRCSNLKVISYETITVLEAQEFRDFEVQLEHKIDSIIPDVVLYNRNKKPLILEIFVTHSIDEVKENKIKELDVPVIEIDLSKVDRYLTRDELKQIIIELDDRKYWVYSPRRQYFMEAISQMLCYRKLSKRNRKFCPLKDCDVINWPYGCFYNYCLNCDYCFYYDKEGVWCGADKNVKTVNAIFDYAKKYPVKKELIDTRLLEILEDSNYIYEKDLRYWKRKGLL